MTRLSRWSVGVSLLLACCGPSWPLVEPSARTSPEPPMAPLELVDTVVLADVSSDDEERRSGIAAIALVAIPTGAQVVWAERRDGEVLAKWAELGDDGRPRWIRELPFVPDDLGVVAGRAVFVRREERGITVCPAPSLECRLVSPMHRTVVSFGPREAVFDFGIGAIRWSPDGRLEPLYLPSSSRTTYAEEQRIGPCGPGWVLAGSDVRSLDDLDSPIGRVEDFGALAIVGATTYALPGRARTATDLCTGRPVRASGPIRAPPVAAFAGSRGLATIRESRSDDGPSAYLYEHAGTRQMLYPEPDSFRAGGARIAGAYLDARSRLCVVVARRARLTVEIHRHRAPAR